MSAARRFERLRAAGTDPAPIQNAIDALRRVAGRSYDTNSTFWDRWGGILWAHTLDTMTGEAVRAWVGNNLVDDRQLAVLLPEAPECLPEPQSVMSTHEAIARFEQRRARLDVELERIEQRCFDAENLGLADARIAEARAVVSAARGRISGIQTRLDACLAARRSEEAAWAAAARARPRRTRRPARSSVRR